MAKRRDLDMANAAENLSDLGDKSAGTQSGTITGGSGGVQGHPDFSDPKEQHSPPHEESYPEARHKNKKQMKKEK